MSEKVTIDRIEKRWKDERRISGRDVEWLISQARRAETMRAADGLRRAGGGTGGDFLSDLLGGFR